MEEASPSPEPQAEPPLPTEPVPDVRRSTSGSEETSTNADVDGKKPFEQEEQVWDPASGSNPSLEGRQAVEEKATGEKDGQKSVTDTQGWQAVWAPTANGMSEISLNV